MFIFTLVLNTGVMTTWTAPTLWLTTPRVVDVVSPPTHAVTVGKSYEIHYVHSSAGYDSEHLKDVDIDLMNDGLGGAANGRGLLNPMVTVQAQAGQRISNKG